MSKNFTFLFGAFLLTLQTSHFVAAKPKATFTPPDSFAVGTEFVGICTADGVDHGTLFQYNVSFWLNSADRSVNPYERYALVAIYTVIQDKATFLSQNASQADLLGLATSQGPTVNHPKFEVNFNPQNDKAKGKYLCSVKMAETVDNVASALEYRSNVWDTSSSWVAIPSTIVLVCTILFGIKFH